MRLTSRREIRPIELGKDEPRAPDPKDAVGQPCIEALYREYRLSLMRRLRRTTSPERASDLVQQVFTRLVSLGPERLAAITSPAGYLRRSVNNLLLDGAKSDRRQATVHHVSADDVDLHAPDQIAALEARDMLQRLEQALRRVNPRTREIFLAHRIDGYSYVEIAARTGLSVKGVEKHMSKAIAFVDHVLSAR
ncbi:sigma-70 family RNA polymerase sigma factor [Sphingomonas sp. BIUV-7]|uniref:Sigma-70 family RNA polymerase sigma factor n=1 Tax=Sphingomonas natans TaxID=3063330 RepID=A0ABT8YCP7_9SPHN|nr:sigma-70 family RNA polymerase sigma factor [Sphingomonas sp. BIUV-7]MDO6416096.1 sigma-70 family RNA polymerase sigma factor [Sphingomonas sp. BIUV-7]